MADKNNGNIGGLDTYLAKVADSFKHHREQADALIAKPNDGDIVEPEETTEEDLIEKDIPDEWLDDEGCEDVSRSEDASGLEPIENPLMIDLSKKPATETTSRPAEDVLPADELDSAAEQQEPEDSPAVEEDADEETAPTDSAQAEEDELAQLDREADELLGEELVAFAENSLVVDEDDEHGLHHDDAWDGGENEEIVSDEMISGIGESSYDVTWSKIPAIYDIRGQEICLGDEMAYRNDYRGIGPVIGIGKDCFFTLTISTSTGREPAKNSLGEVERQQWDLYDANGEKREFYHYNPDTIDKLSALIYDEDYEIDELIDRFRQYVAKERREMKEELDEDKQ